ncbi:MAG: 1-phosphofructokinase family hexose kinase [Defluviitaleaceae bacterium]|nr:1-phosphofructokinase family hexose kinase [Defluviitaleaceae bacterium]
MIKAADNKITVVNLNPCIDWEYRVPEFTFGGMNRINPTRKDIAGKGLNVCIALKNLGLDPLCIGFNFMENGALIENTLNQRGIRHNFVAVEGAIRVNIKLYEESSKIMTELNQPGTFVNNDAQEKLLNSIKGNAILVLSGSRPAGVSEDFYAKICRQWQGKVFLDTEGKALKIAIDTAPPFAIKPNLFELESTFGVSLKEPSDIAQFCRKQLISKGIQIVCVSMGANGAVLVTPEHAYFSPALNIDVKGVQGAGDAMVAGMIYGIVKNVPDCDLLKYAMSAATASVIRDGTEMCSFEDFIIYSRKVPSRSLPFLK